jgi:hypothetical protein
MLTKISKSNMKNYQLFLLLFAITSSSVFAQVESKNDKTIVFTPQSFGVSKPLSELFENGNLEYKGTIKESEDKKNRRADKFLFSPKDGAQYANDESTVQRSFGERAMAGAIANWEGLSGRNGCPLDPSGAAGKNHFVQAINSTPFKIFNKSNGSIVGTVKNLGSLWSPAVDDAGDPIVLYDKYADRWLIAQFDKPTVIHVAVSKTGDPAGSYYTYSFNVGNEFPDYFKLSVWQDGYYMTSNTNTGYVYVFEREKMLLGDAKARVLTKSIKRPFGGFWVPLPADADGVLPPANTPCPFIYYTDNNKRASDIDAVVLQNMTTVWSDTPSLTISNPISIPVAAFDSTYDPNWNDVELGTGTQRVDAIGGAMLYRAQWRKWTGYNTLLSCWSVKSGNGVHNTKWVELRQDQTTKVWALYQEGIYAPDGLSRWLASMAMDDNGNIGMSYVAAGKTPKATPTCLRYTGRLKNDPLGKMTFAEENVVTGSGGATCGVRIGDYAHTSLDPDGVTFWHTGMYFDNGQKSRVYSYKISSTLGVPEFNSDATFNIYQNQNLLNVKVSKLESNKDLIVDLFDLSGKQIFEKNIKNTSTFETSFDISSLPKAVYLVRVGNLDFQKVVKINIE